MIAQHLPIFAALRARFFIKLRGPPGPAAGRTPGAAPRWPAGVAMPVMP